MVDKVERPERISKYDIRPAAETHDEGQRKQDERRDDDEYSSPGTEISWNKFRTEAPNRQRLSLQRSEIRQAVFRQALLQRRAAALEMDLLLADGRRLQRAQFISSNLDDYWKWKGWVPGQVIPLDLMISGQVIEVSFQEPAAGRPRQVETKVAPPPARRSLARKIYQWIVKKIYG